MNRVNPVIASLAILAFLVLPGGCGKKKAMQEAEAAKKDAARAKKALKEAKIEIEDLNEELYIAKNARDELDNTVQVLAAERDKAVAELLQFQQAMQEAAGSEDPVVTALKTEIAQLKQIIAEQEAAIAQLAESVPVVEEMVEPVEEPEVEPVVEPNEPNEPDEGLQP
ncbi:MAG: hypothetical protein ACYS8Z_17410 [Planctomycetota bacterium]|jgi:chromosome segregation ATPase